MEKHCLFCQILRGEKQADFVYQDESLAVIKDIRPQAPVHLLVIPRRHIRSVNDLTEQDQTVIYHLIQKAKETARQQGIDRSGYKLVFNVERGGGQVIFHLHLHLIGGWQGKE